MYKNSVTKTAELIECLYQAWEIYETAYSYIYGNDTTSSHKRALKKVDSHLAIVCLYQHMFSTAHQPSLLWKNTKRNLR